MKNAGVKNKSGFFRAMVLNGYLLRLDLPELREASRQMSILSNNVNLIAKRMNEHGSIYETEIDEIVEKQEEIIQLIRQVYERFIYGNLTSLQRKQTHYFVMSGAETKRREPAQPQRLHWQIRGLGAEPTNKFFAKSSRFALLATMLQGWFKRLSWRPSEKKKFHFVKTFGLKNPVKPSFQEFEKSQKCQQNLTPQRFPKFSKRENDFGSHVIWCQRKPKSWKLPL